MELSRDQLLGTYRTMRTIRSFEQTLNELSQAGRVPGFLHLYAGEEAIAAGVCVSLRDQDCVTSTHRGHGHSIAKGVDLNAMMAEIFGKQAGVCKGKGGSMHIADVGKGMLGANGIVGGGIPLAIGAALSAKVLKHGGVAVAFFGDGATNQGAFHESVNIASILQASGGVRDREQRLRRGDAGRVPREHPRPRRARGELRHARCDRGRHGLLRRLREGAAAIERARRGEGPTLLECKTYRYFGHYVGDPLTYRTKEESEKVRASRDPIDNFEKRVVADGKLKENDLRAVDDQVAKAIADAVRFAEASAAPDPSELTTDVYVRYPS